MSGEGSRAFCAVHKDVAQRLHTSAPLGRLPATRPALDLPRSGAYKAHIMSGFVISIPFRVVARGAQSAMTLPRITGPAF